MGCKFLKNYITVFLTLFLVLFNTNYCCATAQNNPKLKDQRKQIEAKRTHAKKEIHKLKLLEKLETNKLYKNQQKLEYAQHSLQKNQKEYQNTQSEVKALEKKLDVLLVEYKRHQAYTSNRLVQIFKHKRNKYIDFLFSSDDINDFLDRLYFENIIISYDKQKLHESKKCAKDIIALKNRIEMQKKNLEVAISNINRQQVTIQDAISIKEKA